MLKTKKLVRTNVLLDKKLLDEIDRIAEEMAEDRSTAIRQLIKRALEEQKIELALNNLKKGASFRTAASMTGLDYWEFQAELDKREIPITQSVSLAKRRIEQSRK